MQAACLSYGARNHDIIPPMAIASSLQARLYSAAGTTAILEALPSSLSTPSQPLSRSSESPGLQRLHSCVTPPSQSPPYSQRYPLVCGTHSSSSAWGRSVKTLTTVSGALPVMFGTNVLHASGLQQSRGIANVTAPTSTLVTFPKGVCSSYFPDSASNMNA